MQLRLFLCLSTSILAIAAIVHIASADNSEPRPHVQVPAASTTPKMDASDTDPAWASAAVIPALSVSLGKPGEGVSPFPTQVRLLWDEKWLYIRFTCTAGDIYSPFTHHGDKLYQGDVVEIFLDPKGDGKQWYEVEVSPNNVTMEVQATLTTEPKSDANLLLDKEVVSRDWWNNVDYTLEGLRTAAVVKKEGEKVTGWTVDIALPAKVIMRRMGSAKIVPTTMRANFMRYEYPRPAKADAKRSLVAMNWAPVSWGSPHVSPQAMGYLTLVPAGDTKK